MKSQEIFNLIDSMQDEYFKIWEDVCNIESPTNFKAGVDAVGEYFICFAEKRGWQVDVHKEKVAGNAVCISLNCDSPNAPVSFSGHIDTVHPVGSFGTPAVKRDEEKIYGPGVCDCKGGVVAGLMALDALDRLGFRDRPVQLLLQADEECNLSGKENIKYICEKAKDTVAFLNLEGHSAGEACLERKGIVTFEFSVSGIEAHASNCAAQGANAIVEASHKIIEMDKLKDADGITCSTGIVSGGTTVNTVPKSCVFRCNIRYATEEQRKWVSEYAQKVADTTHVKGCSCVLSTVSQRSAMEYKPLNQALLDKMNLIFAENGVQTLTPSKRKGGSDAADTTIYGLPTVDSIGVRGGYIHTRDEYAYLESLSEAAVRLVFAAMGVE